MQSQLLKSRLQLLKLRFAGFDSERFVDIGTCFGQALFFGMSAGQPEKRGG